MTLAELEALAAQYRRAGYPDTAIIVAAVDDDAPRSKYGHRPLVGLAVFATAQALIESIRQYQRDHRDR